MPTELHPTSTTIDYVLNKPTVMPAFLFVVDTSIPETELKSLKESILETLDTIPSNSYVGLITFGRNIKVHSLSSFPCPIEYLFDSEGPYEPNLVHTLLAVGKDIGNGRIQADMNNSFIVSLKSNKKYIKKVISNIIPEPLEPERGFRAFRCTGSAIQFAVGLIENTFAGLGGRIMVFMGGPPSIGQGKVVLDNLKESIRTHNELRKQIAPHVHKATTFYNALAVRAALNGHTVDLFSCSMNQTGLLEMKSLCKSTGGLMVLADSFDHPVFKQSFAKLFDKDEDGNLSMGFNGKLEILTTGPLTLSGCIGHCFSGHKKGKNVSDTEIGVGGTNCWVLCSFDPNANYAFYFDIKNKVATNNPYAYIQFQTTYQSGGGVTIRRVTTISRPWVTSDDHISLLPGFDQEACAALFARKIIYSCENEDIEPLGTIDQTIIKFFKRFCTYIKNNSVSLTLPPELNLYTNFMYYFRRSPLIQVFNNSPDETVYFRYCAFRENVSNILVMMQPSLESYTLDEDPQPVLLSSRSVAPDNILLLDTFFHIIIHTGDLIAQWRKEGYHENPEYENIKELLSMPLEDAEALMKTRLPLPLFVECDQDTSQSRFLLATVDPTFTHLDAGINNTNPNQGQMIFTEDVSLQLFLDKLSQHVVQEN